MPGLMKTFDALSPRHQACAERMVDFARSEMNDCGVKPVNDDRMAVFQEACAVYLNQALLEADHAQAVLDANAKREVDSSLASACAAQVSM